MWHILSATGTYNYALVKWLDEKLKPLSFNHYTITDTFFSTEEIQNLVIDGNNILISYDVMFLFTNVPLQETMAEKVLVTTGSTVHTILTLQGLTWFNFK